MKPNWSPTDQDIVYSNIKRTGIVEQSVPLPDQKYEITVVNPGRQMCERKKWEWFDRSTVQSIIFVASMDYSSCNMSDELQLFETMVGERWFRVELIMKLKLY